MNFVKKIIHMKTLITILISSFTLTSCVTIKPGEVGLKQKLGKLSEQVYPQGPVFLTHLPLKLYEPLFKLEI